jgi:flagellar biogenesis protein FliO
MDWIRSAFSGENSAVMLVLVFLGLLVALVLLAWIFRKIVGDGSVRAGRSRQPRLSVIDAAIVDDKRRLVLVRRDNVEHLVMIGGPTDVVIEPHISRGHVPAPGERGQERPHERSAVRHGESHRRQEDEGDMHAAQAEPPLRAPAQRAPAPVEHAHEAANRAPAGQAAAGNAIAAEAVNGHSIAEEIQIDLEELQAAIDRSQIAEAPAQSQAKQSATTQLAAADHLAKGQAAPEPQAVVQRAPEIEAPVVAAPPPVRAPSLDPDLPGAKAGAKSAKPKSMEDEMQRLLDELSGPIRN